MELQLRLQHAFAPVTAAIESGRIPGAVLGLVDIQGARAIKHAGLAQSVPDKRPMHADTWFDLASLTKVLFTTPRVLEYSLDGAFQLDDPITTVLPDFRQYDTDCWERRITFRECLGHQSPLPAVEPLYTYGQSPDLLRAFILQKQWPKTESVYSDINFILLGLALERLENCTIREMDPGSGFSFSADPGECAATERCTWRHRVLCGEVHDDNCSALQGAGHAGLFGTAESVLNVAHSLLVGDVDTDDALRLMRTPVSSTRTHGWELAHAGWSGGARCGNGAIGHTGFTGTGLWIDFEQGLAWTLLTNRIHPSRHTDSGIAELRQQVGDAVLGSAPSRS
ncbi:MAG: beta-lactamase family protein [Gammaproteobacteria bacterium]|nr:beta-lactamase family protein [Gammaproteobacteria bacterium]